MRRARHVLLFAAADTPSLSWPFRRRSGRQAKRERAAPLVLPERALASIAQVAGGAAVVPERKVTHKEGNRLGTASLRV